MNPETRARLERVAESIADDRPVEWDLERDTTDEGRRRLANLRALELIGAVHRGRDSSRSTQMQRADGRAPDASPGAGTDSRPGADAPTRGTWGTLELRALIGRGGYGEVYRAWDPDLRTEVALKLLRPGSPEEFLGEAQRLARVRHPNVVTVHGARVRDGRVGIWMELIRGATLEELVTRQGPYGAPEATAIGLDVLRALAAVHAAGLLHRDVKASNVMREDGGRIVLMDFSATVESPEDGGRGAESFAGTARYMAPETLAGGPAGKNTDLYALGVLLYRIVTGSYPIDARNARELREGHEHGRVVPLRDRRPDLPVSFVRIVEKATAPDASDRYRSAGEMERDLVRVASPAPPRFPRAAIVVAAAAAVALAVVVTVDRIRPVPLEVDASLFRAGERADERLRAGDRLALGDALFLELRGSRDVWTYVLTEDEAGSRYLLFPLTGGDLANPLAGGVTHRLPGAIDGHPIHWDVTTAGGEERLYVLASTERLDELEATVADLLPEVSMVERGAPMEVPDRALGRLRGIGRTSFDEGAGGEQDTASLAGLFRSLANDADRGGLWTWSIRLANPPNGDGSAP